MNIRKMIQTFALCVGVVLGLGVANAAIIETQTAVVQGAWSSDFEGAKAAAVRDNIPLLVFWGNQGCSHCEALEREMNGDTFKRWMADNQIYMVFKLSDSSCKTWIKDIAKKNGRKISDFPYVAVHWPKNAAGQEVLQGFSAYKGNMGEFGATTKQSNIDQFITALDFLLDGWDPKGVTPVDPVDPVDPPAPVAHTHQWSSWTTTKAATCTAAGEQTRTCAAADCPQPIETQAIKALGHAWSAWVEVKPAAVGVDGLLERTCQRCGEKETKVIPAIDPEPEREEVDLAKVYNKAKSFKAIAYKGDELFGNVAVSISKYNVKKDNVKLTVKISGFNGKTYSKALNVTPNEYGDLEDVEMTFKSPVGEMLVNIQYNDGEFTIVGEGESYTIESGDVTIGGTLEAEEVSLSIVMEELEPESDAYEFIIDAPSDAVASVRSGKTFNFGSAPKIKYVKYREDGETWYELAEIDEDRTPNLNAIKLSYTPKTGAFKGSFSVYASNEGSIDYGKKPKLKTYKGSFSGMVVNGIGVGTVSIKVGKRTYVGSCSFE